MAITPVRKPPVNPEFDPPSSRPLDPRLGDPDVVYSQTNVAPPEARSGTGGYIIAALVLLLGFALVLYYGSRSDTTVTDTTAPATDTTTTAPATDTTTTAPAVPDTTTTQTAPDSTTTTTTAPESTTTTTTAPDSTSTQTTPEAQAPAAPAADTTTTTTQPSTNTTTP